jgi:uncharacterized protein (DUF983 family)
VATAFRDMAHGLCPGCRIGRIFDGPAFPHYPGIARLRSSCVICGVKFHREPGYFLGAMYISYAMVVIIILITLTALAFVTGWGWKLKFAVAIIIVALLTPPMITISRVLWIWLDRKIDPSNT